MTEKKSLLIYNPKAGLSIKRPDVKKILNLLNNAGKNTYAAISLFKGHAKEIAQNIDQNVSPIIACGGDGTLNEVVSGAIKSGVKAKIGYIPTGSTNDLAKNINLPKKLSDLTQLIKNGEARGFDIGKFGDRYFLYIASFGPGVSVSYKTPQRVKNLFGYSAYIVNGFVFQLIPTLRSLQAKHIKIEYDGNKLEDDFYFGTISNALSAAGLFKFPKDEVKFNDGKFEVVLVRKLKNPLSIFPLLQKMRRHSYDGDTLMHFQASNIKMEFDSPEVWTLDGERSEEIQNVEIQVLKEEINIICPNSIHFEKSEAEHEK